MSNLAFQRKGAQSSRLLPSSMKHSSRVGHLGPLDKPDRLFKSSKPTENHKSTQSKSFIARSAVAGKNQKLGNGVPGFKTSFDASGKSGGAFRPISENFSVNPATGTMALDIPIRCSPTRGEFGPSITLSYDSGAGNGVFGFGWGVSVPSISLKTSLGIPRYCGEDDFLFGGSDIVPFLDENGAIVEGNSEGYSVISYRPRIDSRNTKIQKWVQKSTGEVHWRSISGENVTSIFGEYDTERILHGTGAQKRVFSWLLARVFDSRGNAIEYVYKAENGRGIKDNQEPPSLYEQTRANGYEYTQKYLKRIKYGNKKSNRDPETWQPSTWPKDWMFELVFDYGDHKDDDPGSGDLDTWPVRKDPFSNCHSGFEIRTYRLCRRILLFHHFLEELEAEETLVSSQSFEYDESAVRSLLTQVKLENYSSAKPVPPNENQLSFSESLPPWAFNYTHVPDFESLRTFKVETYKLINPPNPKSVSQWLDLEGEGIPGLLNRLPDGNLSYQNNRGVNDDAVSFDEIRLLDKQINILDHNSSLKFQDLDRNGHIDMVVSDAKGNPTGFHEWQDSDSWSNYSEFSCTTNATSHADVLHSIDLTGDGFSDKLYEITDSREIVWTQSLQKEGISAHKVTFSSFDQRLPRLQGGTDSKTYMSDMTGDGLSDILEVTDSNIIYWQNLGWGAFGNAVIMANPPQLARYGILDYDRIQLIDIDGTGTTDMIYVLPSGGAVLFFNQAGNSWSDGFLLKALPRVSSPSSIFALDIKGNGTACLCWYENLNISSSTEIQYIDLMDGLKPHLLESYNNGMGGSTTVTYVPSTKFYLEDRGKGQPWTSKIPFPVQVISSSKTTDHITGKVVTSDYRYRNGAYDPSEKQFAGFEMVEHITYEKVTIGPDEVWDSFPTLTKSWFNVGLNLHVDESRFFDGTQVQSLSHIPSNEDVPGNLLPMRGAPVRTETYSLDGTDKAVLPLSVEERSYDIRLLQSKRNNKYAVYQMLPRAGIITQFDRNTSDPRTSSNIALKVDQFGIVEESLEVVYPRGPTEMAKIEYQDVVDNQRKGNVSFVRSYVTDSVNDLNNYRTPLVYRHQDFEIVGFNFNGLINVDQIREFDFLALPDQKGSTPSKHLRTEEVTTFRSSSMESILSAPKLEAFSLIDQTYALAFTPNVLDKIKASHTSLKISVQSASFNERSLSAEVSNPAQQGPLSLVEALHKGGYVQLDQDSKENWWLPSPRVCFSVDKTPINELKIAHESFYVPTIAEDAFGNFSFIKLDGNFLLITETEDAIGNTVHYENDYVHVQTCSVMDSNLNINKVFLDTMGRPVATAMLGKNNGSDEEDSLIGLTARCNSSDASAILSDPLGETTTRLLGNAESRIVHCTDAYYEWSVREEKVLKTEPQSQESRPPANFSISISRNLAFRQSKSPLLDVGVTFFDGFGNAIQQATLNDPTDSSKEWIISGHAVTSAGISRTYHPFFSHSPELVRVADIRTPSSTTFYDAAGRSIASLTPDNLWSKMKHSGWAVTEHDVGDLVLSDPSKDADIAHFFAKINQSPSWHKVNIQGSTQQQMAAKKSEAYVACPQTTHFGSCGLPVRLVHDVPGDVQTHAFQYDYSGNKISDEDNKGRITEKNTYDKVNRRLASCGMDSGESWALQDVRGGIILNWNSRGICFQFKYDKLGREIQKWMHTSIAAPRLVVLTEYGNLTPENQRLNLVGHVTKLSDQSGVYTHQKYDIRGHDIENAFQPAKDYKAILDWNVNVELGDTKFQTSASFDSKGHLLQQKDSQGNLTRRVYSRHGQITTVDFCAAQQSEWKTHLTSASFTPDGLPANLEYGNDVSTQLIYDEKTRELISQKTTRTKKGRAIEFGDFVSPKRSRQLAAKQEQRRSRSTQTLIEDYTYTYDCHSRLIYVFDVSEQAKYFRDNKVLAEQEYTYNSLGQIVFATGRANLPSQQKDAQLTPHHARTGSVPNRGPVDGNKMYKYLESYTYDRAGNMETMKHEAMNDSFLRGWTRHFVYEEGSLLSEDQKITSNRLSRTRVASNVEEYKYDGEESVPYSYDYLGDAGAMGCMTSIPKYSKVAWNMDNLMASSSTQKFINGGAETTYYVYNHSGHRVRKITEGSFKNGEKPSVRRDTMYLDGVEIQLKFSKNHGSTTRKIARVSGDGHISDVETVHREKKLGGAGSADGGNSDKSDESTTDEDSDVDDDDDDESMPLVRYQIGSSMELDDQGQLVSYEEYSPFGSTVFSAMQDSIEAPRTYRFAKYEHDRETGLYHCGARYYCPWLGRWTSPDPLGDVDGPNLYIYCANDPINSADHEGTSLKTQGITKRGNSSNPRVRPDTPDYAKQTLSWKGKLQQRGTSAEPSGKVNSTTTLPQIGPKGQKSIQGSNTQGLPALEKSGQHGLDVHVQDLPQHKISTIPGLMDQLSSKYPAMFKTNKRRDYIYKDGKLPLKAQSKSNVQPTLSGGTERTNKFSSQYQKGGSVESPDLSSLMGNNDYREKSRNFGRTAAHVVEKFEKFFSQNSSLKANNMDATRHKYVNLMNWSIEDFFKSLRGDSVEAQVKARQNVIKQVDSALRNTVGTQSGKSTLDMDEMYHWLSELHKDDTHMREIEAKAASPSKGGYGGFNK